MADVIVIGGGPAGYSAALFTSKYGLDTIIYDTNETKMHSAYLYNYLGIKEIGGTEFMKIVREQVEHFGTKIREARVIDARREGDAFIVETEEGRRERAKYLVFATGLDAKLLENLGIEFEGDEVKAGRYGETSAENVYAAGWVARPQSQAIISAGDGAAAAIHLISKEEGKPYKDFDVPPAEG